MKKILLILFLISVITLTVFSLTGTYTTNGYFYMPGFGEYGTAAFDEYETYMQIADTQIEANKDAFDNFILSNITDVDLTDIADTKILKYNSTTSKWECENDSGAGSVDTSGTPVQYDIARFTDADTIEGRSYSELKADLDLEIGTDVQAWDAQLDDIAALSYVNSNFIVGNGSNWVVESGETVRTSLGLAIGTNVEAHDDGLLSIAGLTTAANKSIYTTALDTYAVYDLSAFGRTIVDDADASAVRTTLGLVIGTNIQAYDAALTSISGLTYVSSSFIKLTANDTYAVRTITEVITDLALDSDDLSDVASIAMLDEAESITENWVNTTNPWADNEVADDITIDLATLATTFTCTDNENEALACPIVFVDGATGAQGAETDGDITYNPSTGTLTVTALDLTTALPDAEVANNITIDLATLATTITVTDNEATAENNPICFVAGADPDGGSLGIETDGDLHYNPSTGILTATGFAGALTGAVTGNADTCTTASAGDAAVDFFGAGVDAVTDATECTDIEGTLLSIGGTTLNAAIPADHITYDMMQDATDTDKVLGRSTAGAGTVEEIACTAAGRALIDDADASAQRTTLGLVIGTDVEVDLSNEAGLYAVLSDVALFLEDTIDDTSPELGGELDAGAHTIGFTQQTATGDGTTTVNWTLGNKMKFTFGAQNDTFTFTAPTNPCNILLMLIQDGTGSRTATWPGTVKWVGGTAPTLTTGANTIDICSFYWDGSNYFGVASLAFAVP